MKESQKTVTVGGKSYDALWAKFAENETPAQAPAGGITSREYSDRFGVTRSAAASILTRKAKRSELVRVKEAYGLRTVRYFFLS